MDQNTNVNTEIIKLREEKQWDTTETSVETKVSVQVSKSQITKAEIDK